MDSTKELARESDVALTLGYQHLINTTRGINGLAFDIQDLAVDSLTTADFHFQVSPLGAFMKLKILLVLGPSPPVLF
jgi:hypothetical protein